MDSTLFSKEEMNKPKRRIGLTGRTGSINALNDKWFITIAFGSKGNTIPNSVRILPNGTIIEPTAKK